MNILILGGTGKIGKNIYKRFSLFKEYNLYTLSRSKNPLNIDKHYIFDFHKDDISNFNINISFDIIINCLGSEVYKEETLLKNFFKKFMNLLNSNFESSWIEISSISAFGINNINKEDRLISNYGKSKLLSENLLKDLSKKHNRKCTIFRFGAVIKKDEINNFVFKKFNKFKIFRVFISFFKSEPYLRITLIEDIYELIYKTISEKNKKNKIITTYKNINIHEILRVKYKNLYIINFNYKIIYTCFFYINKIMYIKFSSVFNPNLNSNDKHIFQIIDF